MRLKILSHKKPSIALCTLGSLNWGIVRHPDDMRRPARVLVRALHNLLQYQDFLSIQSKLHNKEFEPLGIGITNLAYWHAKRKLKYGEPEALAEVKRWMEHQAFYLTEMSVEIAKEKGPATEAHRTRYGQGIFPWELRASGVNELTDFSPSAELDWESLRSKLKQHGIRNTTLMAIAPVESSSVVLNSTNGVNMVKQLIIVKSSKAGEFVQVVPEYRKLKKHYQLMWDQADCNGYIKTVAVLQAFVDQGISADTWYSPKHFPEGKIPATLIAKNLMLAAKWGLKSFYYDLRSKQDAANQLKVELKIDNQENDARIKNKAFPGLINNNNKIDKEDDDHCESCVL